MPDKKLKIGFWGNMNNNPFIIARTFREMGHEVLFIIDDHQKLHRPEFRYEDVGIPYPEWIKDFSPFSLVLLANVMDTGKKTQIIELLNQCDFVYLNGYSIRFAGELRKPHFVHLTGSDLDKLADYQEVDLQMRCYHQLLLSSNQIKKDSLTDKWLSSNKMVAFASAVNSVTFLKFYSDRNYLKPRGALYNLFYFADYKKAIRHEIKKQRNSIRSAFSFLYAPAGLLKKGDAILNEIGVHEEKRISFIPVDINLTDYVDAPKNTTVRIFNVARFSWIKTKSTPGFTELDFKGNDIMIKGIALYYHTNKLPLDIRFVKKGQDVTETMQLCKDLRIDHMITWLDELTQKEVMEECKNADIIFDQLSNSVVTMGGLEAMSVGRPLIANSRPDVYERTLGEKTAICQATSPEEVCVWLEKLVPDEDFRKKKGMESRAFVVKHFAPEKLAAKILDAFGEAERSAQKAIR